MNSNKVKEVLIAISNKINEEKDFLTELDNKIADGDHGINLARGFSAVEEMIKDSSDEDLGTIFKNVGMKLVSTVGGAAGPLYGTAFLRAANVVNNKNDISLVDFVYCLDAAIEGVKFRGKSVQGEKTMLDAMIPALEAINNSLANKDDNKTALYNGVNAAFDGVDYTKTIVATKGRASYIGDRSIGYQDPGATSFSLILETIYKEVY